jgi:hypothetical protein
MQWSHMTHAQNALAAAHLRSYLLVIEQPLHCSNRIEGTRS